MSNDPSDPSACACLETQYDAKLGHTVCIDCGRVLEENAVVAELGFSETKGGAIAADGFFIGAGLARAKAAGGFNKFGMAGTDEGEKHANALANGNRKIAEIAGMVRMSQRHIEIAERYFKLAASHGFTKGRKVTVVATSCLYIVCRLEKTSHMLMDFADVLEINVYVIGTTYMRLAIVLNLRDHIEHIDPAIYIQRFAARLEFEDKSYAVISDALRLVSRMDRDWIKQGRRPAGICAAALFIAARMNGLNRTISEIVHVVKICGATLRRRLQEFSSTDSANLTVDSFSKVWLDENHQPPSYTSAQKAAHALKEAAKTGKGKGKRVFDDEEDDDDDDDDFHQESDDGRSDTAYATGTGSSNQSSSNNSEADDSLHAEVHKALEDHHLLKMESRLDAKDSGKDDANLDDLDDDWEVSNALISKEEVEFKQQIWETLNAEYCQLQKARMASQAAGGKKNSDPSKKRKKKQAVPLPPAHSAFDATTTMLKAKAPALSSRINYDLLKEVLE